MVPAVRDLGALSKAYRVARGERKLELARELVRRVSRYSRMEPFWEGIKGLGVKPSLVKDALTLLEEAGEIRIRRSVDGRRLYVLTLREIRKNPVKLDAWLFSPRSRGGVQTPSHPRRRGR